MLPSQPEPAPTPVIVDADFAEIEVRIAELYRTHPDVVPYLAPGVDYHALTASKIYGVPLDQVTPEQRHFGKHVNFDKIYGTPHSPDPLSWHEIAVVKTRGQYRAICRDLGIDSGK